MALHEKTLLAASAAGSFFVLAGILKLVERPTSPSLTRTLWESRDVAKKCGKLLSGVSVSGTRSFVVTAYTHLTFEHHAAILSLFRRGCFGSANALFRPCIEAAARGMWLAKCASDLQITKFANGERFEFPPFPDLVRAIDVQVNRQVNAKGLFAMFGGKDMWRVINDFCHGGNIQVARRMNAGQFQPSYPEPELRSFLILATSAVLLSTHTVFESATENQASRMVRLKAVADAYVRSVVLKAETRGAA